MTEGRLTLRAVVAAVVLLVVTNVLMRSTEFVMGRYITAGVPPVAAVCGLLLLLGLTSACAAPGRGIDSPALNC